MPRTWTTPSSLPGRRSTTVLGLARAPRSARRCCGGSRRRSVTTPQEFIGLECLDIGMPIAQMRGLAARAAENFDFFAASIEELLGPGLPRRRRLPQLHGAQAGRRGRADHALERAADALDVADRAVPRRREHDRPQARRVVAADRDPPRRADATRSGCRPASSTSFTASARLPARPLVAHPGVNLDLLHGRVGDGVGDHGRRRADAQALLVRARRQVARRRVRRTPTSTAPSTPSSPRSSR